MHESCQSQCRFSVLVHVGLGPRENRLDFASYIPRFLGDQILDHLLGTWFFDIGDREPRSLSGIFLEQFGQKQEGDQ